MCKKSFFQRILITVTGLAIIVPVFGVNAKDSALVTRLRGSILLHVQSHGEAWYIRPKDSKRYYLKDGAMAYSIMRSFGLGITDADLAKIPKASNVGDMKATPSACSTNALANRLRGEILLQVQQHGEIWYVDPVKCRAIYLKDGAAAYNAMRFLGLGVTTADLQKIQDGGTLAVGSSNAAATPTQVINPPVSACTDSANAVCAQNDRALDALVVIDTSTYLQNGRRWNGYGYITDDAIRKGFDAAQLSLANKAGVTLKLQKIIRVSFGTDLTPDEGNLKMLNWASSYLRTPDPPEAFIIISKMGVSWEMGGYSQWVAAPSDAPYCNEFAFWMPGAEAQRHATVAVIDWDHLVGACGYNNTVFPGTERVSDKPTNGECRNNLVDVCELSPSRQIYMCRGLTVSSFPNVDPDVWHEFTIVHELLHAVDVTGLGNQAHSGGTQETYNMAPNLLKDFSLRLKGCPAS